MAGHRYIYTDQWTARVLWIQFRESLHTPHSWLRKWNKSQLYRHLCTSCKCPVNKHTRPDRQFRTLVVAGFRVDAYLPLRSAWLHRRSNRNDTQHTGPTAPNTPMINKPAPQSPDVAVIRAGSRVPQSHLIELKTYSKARKV